MKNACVIAALALALVTAGLAQGTAGPGAAKPEPVLGGDITGLYSFVHEGEFVQIEVNDGNVTGLVSRFKNEDLDKAEFVDQFFEQAKLEGSTLSFRTKAAADGVWFEFSGTVERGPAARPGREGYWNVKGTVTEHRVTDGKATVKVHELTLKSFPEDVEPNPAGKTGTETEKTDKKE